ncbi:hypothetical protein SAMN05443244_0498 [Terriglobus roseus]|jgi:hypothetical protein|uniref:Uncharacterized protein n=1 Tax=Terriglobus roseus TaxID=392734 RepID=A0A1H4JC18_9BACT|nr:hypothetical protein SAMN05443244_0498 [Terriglobus roseus]
MLDVLAIALLLLLFGACLLYVRGCASLKGGR